MARMFPSQNETFPNDGEKIFYRFIEHAAKPDSKYMCWYIPDVKGEEPDFILYCEDIGLVIIEVKLWVLGQIKEINPHEVRLEGFKERMKNPLKQARDYSMTLRDRLKRDGRLVSRESQYAGKMKIPVNYGVAFPNITRHEYEQSPVAKVIQPAYVFLWDDLNPDSELAQDASGKKLLNQLKIRFPPLFDFKLEQADRACLREILFPEVRIELPVRKSDKGFEAEKHHIKLLDNHQEAIARQIDAGHRIIRGPSGSGKTLVLIHRAIYLFKYNPAVKHALFVCYNITLVNYIKQLFAGKGIPIGPDGIEILHFFELCSKIMGEAIQYEKQDMDYYNLVVSEALDRVSACGLKYDLILLDEGQDFSNDMFRVITALMNKKTNHLMIAIDENQDIYKPNRTWQDAGIDAKGRIKNLTAVYRNTKQIYRLAGSLIGLNLSVATKKDHQERIFDDTCTMDGPNPEIIRFDGYPAMTQAVAGQIEAILAQGNVPSSEIAVLYTHKGISSITDTTMPELVKAALESRGILSNWIAEDYWAKKAYDISTNNIAISTIHSVKGMDFHCVFLVGLDLLENNDRWTEQQLRNLTYVGMTRARYRLVIPYVIENELISHLLATTVSLRGH